MEETASLNLSPNSTTASAAQIDSSANSNMATDPVPTLNLNPSATPDPATVPPLPEETASLPSLTPVLRILGSLLIFIGGLACLAIAAIITLATALTLPAFLYLGLERPFISLFSTIGYLVSVMCLLAIGIFASRLAFNLIRKQEITRKILFTCGITLAMALVCLFLVLPAAAAPIRDSVGTPQQHFTNPIQEDVTRQLNASDQQ